MLGSSLLQSALIGLQEGHGEKSLLLDPFLFFISFFIFLWEGVCNEFLFWIPLNLNACTWLLVRRWCKMRLTHLLSKNIEPTLNKFIWGLFFFAPVFFCLLLFLKEKRKGWHIYSKQSGCLVLGIHLSWGHNITRSWGWAWKSENLIRKDEAHFQKPKYFITGMHHSGNMIDFPLVEVFDQNCVSF